MATNLISFSGCSNTFSNNDASGTKKFDIQPKIKSFI